MKTVELLKIIAIVFQCAAAVAMIFAFQAEGDQEKINNTENPATTLIDSLYENPNLLWERHLKKQLDTFPPEGFSTPVEEGYICKHCGEPLYRQYGGTWVHSTFDDGGYINCMDHKNKKANEDNWGKYPNAEPADRV